MPWLREIVMDRPMPKIEIGDISRQVFFSEYTTVEYSTDF